MAAQNPYDRRGHRPLQTHHMGLFGVDEEPRRPSPIEFRDLEAMVANAVRRGSEIERNALVLEQQSELDTVRRLTWDEGHEAGEGDGRIELLERIDRYYGEHVRQAIAELALLTTGDPKSVTKDALSAALKKAHGLLASLVEAHHNGFVYEPLPPGVFVVTADVE